MPPFALLAGGQDGLWLQTAAAKSALAALAARGLTG